MRRWLALLAIAIVIGGAAFFSEAATARRTPGGQLFDGHLPRLGHISGHERRTTPWHWTSGAASSARDIARSLRELAALRRPPAPGSRG